MNTFMGLQVSLHVLAVVLIDLTLAANNATIISLAARGLPTTQRRQAIIYGTGFAALMRMGMTLIASHLLNIVGLTLLGGILLLWVCWNILRDLRHTARFDPPERSSYFGEALLRIVIVDFTMSFDNVIAVGGAATYHPVILLFGLAISVLLMMTVSLIAAQLFQRFRWLMWSGLAIIFAVSLKLILQGGYDAWHFIAH